MTDESLPKALLLPYPPSVNRTWQFIGGRRPIKSSAAKAYAEVVGWRAREAGWKPLQGPIGVRLVLHPLRPKKTRPGVPVRCIDLDAAFKVIFDALNGIAWVDDKQVHEIHAKRGEPVPCGLVQIEVRELSTC